LIEDVGRDAESCGITMEKVRRAVLYPASSARFEIRPPRSVGGEAAIYVALNTLFFERLNECVTNIQFQVLAYQQVMLRFSGREVFAGIELWSRNRIFSSDKGDHARMIAEAIEGFTKEFVTDWNLANK
jgi:hypothetical protein